MSKLTLPWEHPPAEGEAIEVAEGILWMRLPLPMALDHVNIYALDDGDSWTIIDTGMKSGRTQAIWESLLAGPMGGKPVGRVLLTHHHPDHIGMAGWFIDQGAELLSSRTSYLMGRMLILDVEDKPSPQSLKMWRAAGVDKKTYDTRAKQRPFNFADICHPLPLGYTRLQEGDVIHAAGRNWDIRVGNGHAPEHLTLWSQDGDLILAGDQIIHNISPNIGVYPTEPAANPLADWLDSCKRLSKFATKEQLVLSGHKLPFKGLPIRFKQLIDNHIHALDRLKEHLRTPRVAADCFAPIFKRNIDGGTYGLALVETVAHLNYLHQAGNVSRTTTSDGVWIWKLKE